MSTSISPMLAVSDGQRAIDFYKRAFGAVERWRIDAGGSVVAGMTVDDAEFFLADASPRNGTHSPDSIAGTTVRIELFVDDPQTIAARAVAAGAVERNAVTEHSHTAVDGSNFKMLQGMVIDPFGHVWLIGKFLDG